jgi:hypothetical protein
MKDIDLYQDAWIGLFWSLCKTAYTNIKAFRLFHKFSLTKIVFL